MSCEHKWTIQRYRAGVKRTSMRMFVVTCKKCGMTRTIEGDDQDLKKLLSHRKKRMGLRIALATILGTLLLVGGLARFFSSPSYKERRESRRNTDAPARETPQRNTRTSRPAPKRALDTVTEKPAEIATPTTTPGEDRPAAVGGTRQAATGIFHGLGPLQQQPGAEHVLPQAGGANMIALLTGETIVSTETAPTTPEEKATWEEMWRLAGEWHRHELERKQKHEAQTTQRYTKVKAKLEAQFAEIASLKLGPGTALTNSDGDALPDGVSVEVHFFDDAGRRVRPRQGTLTCSLINVDPGDNVMTSDAATVVAEWRFEIKPLSLEPEPSPPDWALGEPSFQASLAWRDPQPGTQLLCTFVEPGGDPVRAKRAF